MVSMGTDPVRQSLQAAVRGRLREPAALPDPEYAEASWAALTALGAPALDAPLAADGLALGLAASTAVAEELGRVALPTRYLAVAFAIDAAAAGDAPESLLRALTDGELPVCVTGFGGPPDAAGGARLAPVRDVLVLTDGDRSTALCPLDGGAASEGPLARARVRQAAYLYGLARGALVAGVQYAGRRRQFDRTLREFQAIAFRLAESYVAVEALRLLVSRAAWLADGGHPYGQAATEALATAAETAAGTAQTVLQVCGVRGMTSELRVHRHYLRVRDEARRLGTAREMWRELGRDRLRAA